MNKFFTVMCLVMLSAGLLLAGVELTPLWEMSAAQEMLPNWFDTDNLTRGFAYGKVGENDRLFVVSRNGGSFIYILDAATGDSVGMLDNTGITGGIYHVSDVAVSDDGVVFVCNLAIGGEFKIYKWTDEAAVPEVAITADGTDRRLGDKISAMGSLADNSFVLYAASAANNEILKFTTSDNGATFDLEVIDIGTNGGSASVGPIPGMTDFYYNATGLNPKKFDSTGADLGTIPGSVVSTGSNSIRYITTKLDAEYIATFQYGTDNENARIVKVPEGDLAAAETYTITPSLGANANANGSGDVAVQDNGDGTFTVFVLSTNNGLGAYLLEIIPVLTIAEARVDMDGDFVPDLLDQKVTVRGYITTPNYSSSGSQYYMQDATGGVQLYNGGLALDLNFGDEVQVTGFVDQYRGSTEIVDFTEGGFTVLSTGNEVEPKEITIADLGEDVESQLILLQNVWMVDPSQWPEEGSNGNVDITDGTDTTYIFIDRDTDLDGWTPPQGMLNIEFIVDQYTYSEPANDGYSLRGTFREGIMPVITEEPEELIPLWSKAQATGNMPSYFSTSSYTRGMAYGKVNGEDRVYVVTRFGPHRIVIHDALTGDSLGVIPKPPQAEGVGLFHLNCVDVSDDGIIFASNMSLGSDTNHPFRVYRWDSETAEAQTAISYDAGLGRMGDMFSVYGSASDNSLTIYAGVANSNKFVRFTTADNGMTFTPEVIEIEGGSFGTLPNVAEMADGTMYVKSYGRPLVHLDASGAVVDTVSTTVVGTGGSKIKAFSYNESQMLMVYYPDLGGAGSAENCAVIDVTEGAAGAEIVALSGSIGSTANGNGTGSVDVMHVMDDTHVFFVMGTNNGVAAFTNDDDFVIAMLDTMFFGDTQNVLVNPFGAGYIAGTNEYNDIGKYQRFDFKAGDELVAAKFYFGYKNIVDTPDSIWMVVKSVAENGAPDSMLASAVTTTDMLDTTGMGNTFFLDAPLMVEGPVFIGFEWKQGDDEFAVFSDADGEGDGENRAWERFEDSSYNDFLTTLNPDYSWGIDVDLWIAAYYKEAVGTGVISSDESAAPETFVLSQNYPNPFNPTTRFSVNLQRTTDVRISVFNTLGQEVSVVYDGQLTAGIHNFEFDAKDMASGVYFYRLKGADVTAVKRMILLK
ncbi:T9SS type A sorting domain-containing protein [candidate division KSB1 bacterium]|nr:T9SS type A sorting domain-containing protein [candidate division KSB1 bacterium]